MPYKHITVNLAPADLPKEGSQFDLPIVLAMMVAMEAIAPDAIAGYAAIGELALDGSIRAVPGALPAAIGANAIGKGLICPQACGPRSGLGRARTSTSSRRPISSRWSITSRALQTLPRPKPNICRRRADALPDLVDVKGQESAKRVLEIAAAGGHNLLMIGPPGSGKSMLAARLPSILPPLSPEEMLEVSMVHSLAGELMGGKLAVERPFRAPASFGQHGRRSSAAARARARARCRLAHLGVLFLDELPEFQPNVLDALRQPLEAGETVIARANHRIAYPSRIQLIAAMNPCKCGGSKPGQLPPRPALRGGLSGAHLRPAARPHRSADRGAGDSRGRPRAAGAVRRQRRSSPPRRERRASASAGARLQRSARRASAPTPNARASCWSRSPCPTQLACTPAPGGRDALKLSARGFHRTLKVARTLADLDGEDTVRRAHIAEALSYRGETLAQTRAA